MFSKKEGGVTNLLSKRKQKNTQPELGSLRQTQRTGGSALSKRLSDFGATSKKKLNQVFSKSPSVTNIFSSQPTYSANTSSTLSQQHSFSSMESCAVEEWFERECERTEQELAAAGGGDGGLSQFSVKDLAEQLSLKQHELFVKIDVASLGVESLLPMGATATTAGQRQTLHVQEFINHFNRVTFRSVA
jgi:hypothetical protein